MNLYDDLVWKVNNIAKNWRAVGLDKIFGSEASGEATWLVAFAADQCDITLTSTAFRQQSNQFLPVGLSGLVGPTPCHGWTLRARGRVWGLGYHLP
ncbi:unnamed protein product [Prunus armeniaca]